MKIYKQNILTLVLTVTALTFASCGDWLVLYPEDNTIEEEFWENGNQAGSVVRACYRYLQEDDAMQRIIWWGELRGDNVTYYSGAASTAERDIVDVNIKASNSIVKWDPFYEVINYCNKVIETAPSVVEKDANYSLLDCQNNLAEAYTIRALCYFYLVRTFRDVPFVTESSKTDQKDYNVSNEDTTAWLSYYNVSSLTATTNQEFYVIDHLIADMELAVTYAAEEWKTEADTKGRITRNAARALLADLYLWKASILEPIDLSAAHTLYGKCAATCSEIIDTESETFTMVSNENMFNSIFYTGNSSESIFELNFTNSGHANNATSGLYGNPTGKNKIWHLYGTESAKSIYNIYSSAPRTVNGGYGYDTRSKDNFYASSTVAFKYEGQNTPTSFKNISASSYSFRSSSSQANWIFYRLPEIYLMKAEALAQIATTEEEKDAVISLCNVSYKRACTLDYEVVDSLNHNTISDVKTLVLEERRRELIFEGKRWFDLLRLARRENSVASAWNYVSSKYDEDVTTIKNKMATLDAWYLPISSDELKLNGNLRQNSFYTTQEN